MKRIESYWAKLVGSRNAAEEAEAVEKLRQYLADTDISFKAVIVTDQNEEVAYPELTSEHQIKHIRMTFLAPNGRYEAPEWFPHDAENFYALFLE